MGDWIGFDIELPNGLGTGVRNGLGIEVWFWSGFWAGPWEVVELKLSDTI